MPTAFLRLLLAILLSGVAVLGQTQDLSPYRLYNGKGKKVSFKKLVKSLDDDRVLLFGELHNSPISHWLQMELTKAMQERRDLVLGAEMIEADDQQVLNDYLAGRIDAQALDTLARLWPNYDTDYAGLVDLAKEKGLAFVATNIPRRYAKMVHYGGFEALDDLSEEEKEWMAPLPIPFDIELPTYQNILRMMGDHGSPNLVMAQAIKDATMAHFILSNSPAEALFIHYNGAYHSDHYEGINWYLRQRMPDLAICTISTVVQSDIGSLEAEHLGRADFIICVDEDVTGSY